MSDTKTIFSQHEPIIAMDPSTLNHYGADGYFSQLIQNDAKMPETLVYGLSSESAQRELSIEYQYDRV